MDGTVNVLFEKSCMDGSRYALEVSMQTTPEGLEALREQHRQMPHEGHSFLDAQEDAVAHCMLHSNREWGEFLGFCRGPANVDWSVTLWADHPVLPKALRELQNEEERNSSAENLLRLQLVDARKGKADYYAVVVCDPAWADPDPV